MVPPGKEQPPPAIRRRFSFGSFLTYFAITLAVYFLSVGSVAVLMDRGIIKHSAAPVIKVIYAPVIWLMEDTPLGKPYDLYLKLWIDTVGGWK